MYKNRKLLIAIGSILLVTIVTGIISAWVITYNLREKEFEIGEIAMEVGIAENELDIDIKIFSPTFLLDPDVRELIDNNTINDPIVIKFIEQFAESVSRVTVEFKNTGNIPGVLGYGSSSTAKGLEFDLINTTLNNSNLELQGMLFLITEYNTNVSSNSYYNVITNYLYRNNVSLAYTNFGNLKSDITNTNNSTIDYLKTIVIAPNSSIKIDIFIWQEFYDLGSYESSFYNFSNGNIYQKQNFKINIKAYFDQLGISK